MLYRLIFLLLLLFFFVLSFYGRICNPEVLVIAGWNEMAHCGWKARGGEERRQTWTGMCQPTTDLDGSQRTLCPFFCYWKCRLRCRPHRARLAFSPLLGNKFPLYMMFCLIRLNIKYVLEITDARPGRSLYGFGALCEVNGGWANNMLSHWNKMRIFLWCMLSKMFPDTNEWSSEIFFIWTALVLEIAEWRKHIEEYYNSDNTRINLWPN